MTARLHLHFEGEAFYRIAWLDRPGQRAWQVGEPMEAEFQRFLVVVHDEENTRRLAEEALIKMRKLYRIR